MQIIFIMIQQFLISLSNLVSLLFLYSSYLMLIYYLINLLSSSYKNIIYSLIISINIYHSIHYMIYSNLIHATNIYISTQIPRPLNYSSVTLLPLFDESYLLYIKIHLYPHLLNSSQKDQSHL
jgi:hypothetical protein